MRITNLIVLATVNGRKQVLDGRSMEPLSNHTYASLAAAFVGVVVAGFVAGAGVGDAVVVAGDLTGLDAAGRDVGDPRHVGVEHGPVIGAVGVVNVGGWFIGCF